jgi:hypothetical protein
MPSVSAPVERPARAALIGRPEQVLFNANSPGVTINIGSSGNTQSGTSSVARREGRLPYGSIATAVLCDLARVHGGQSTNSERPIRSIR